MRKFFITVVCLTTFSATFKSSAQGVSAPQQNEVAVSSSAITFGQFKKPPDENPAAVSDRVYKNFNKQFAGVHQATWIENKRGYVVRFTANGMQHHAYLTKQGYCKSIVRNYTEKELPEDVRHQVKSRYYDFAIANVTEVKHNQITAYLVTIADKTSWKILRLVAGEMEVWRAYTKG